ncbi:MULTISPECIES: GntR family transcriptional regulator [Streptomyces]|uniref:GntR family transcriptional regulator n=1 Tax=Streptomyces TaxID=1883 RepID=UPI0015A6A043|nr:winged helix-turn-helix domain-containing protein [Streptomyces caniscabiei]MBE4738107.1 winged helix-turn-helix transcriptional regulator [Streptomyces caniscabiei]MBE4756870.1 winged helix-turn-helix transcriptional regulator [Streptomyces caniscabiei]MBE4773810.1 winged helix-turn-helix transcriptional regulator [Streptomyces caniscabiei]MBE4785620.1 winged helix-turn-helix transcriptional regulator [Streptomyces caniscabiei]MBE4796963.1 winged helix-turn-helix transcriptional regulator 
MVVTQENVAVNDGRKLSSQEIAATLRDRIRGGHLRPGERLPTQAELAEEFGVERGTVRQALRALQDDGLLSNVSKGSPPRVAEVGPAASNEPQPTMVGLGPRLADAFSTPHVRIDAACLTAETLMLALGEPVRRIHEGTIRPESIDVRILLPSRKINLAFPVPVEGRGEDDEEDPVHRRWLDQRNAQIRVLRHNLQALRTSHKLDVSVTFRALPFTPPVKLYLLNGQEALIAYYMLMKREEQMADGPLQMYDAFGTQSLLFSFEKETGPRDAAFVDQSQQWFNALWETITTDLTLS